ncbi:hypothetical protein O9929_13255 [Vibrio lentus]|nr:hypothetical protein [Vibrio lentus]
MTVLLPKKPAHTIATSNNKIIKTSQSISPYLSSYYQGERHKNIIRTYALNRNFGKSLVTDLKSST